MEKSLVGNNKELCRTIGSVIVTETYANTVNKREAGSEVARRQASSP